MGAVTRLAVALLMVAAAGACGGGRGDPAPTPDVRPSQVTRRLAPGIEVDLTATVSQVLGPTAFLLADADLPPDGQLVVSDTPAVVEVTELLRVTGRTAVLDEAALRRYGVTVAYTGGPAVVASSIHHYLPPTTLP